MKLKLLVGLALAGALVFAAATVPLGERTLWEHGRRVFSTPEAAEAGRDIEDGSKELVADAVTRAGDAARHAYDRVRAGAASGGADGPGDTRAPDSASPAPAPTDGTAAPMDDHAAEDKARLRELLK